MDIDSSLKNSLYQKICTWHNYRVKLAKNMPNFMSRTLWRNVHVKPRLFGVSEDSFSSFNVCQSGKFEQTTIEACFMPISMKKRWTWKNLAKMLAKELEQMVQQNCSNFRSKLITLSYQQLPNIFFCKIGKENCAKIRILWTNQRKSI